MSAVNFLSRHDALLEGSVMGNLDGIERGFISVVTVSFLLLVASMTSLVLL